MKRKLIALGTVILVFFCATISYGKNEAAAPAVDSKVNYARLFEEVFYRIKKDYVEEPTDKQLIESAINGMLTSLDPHSEYLDEKAYEEMGMRTKGEFGGLGIEVTMENGLVKVVSPIDDTPASKGGIKPGDLIISIDNEQVMGLTLTEAVNKMRGAAGSKIHLTILRENQSEPLEIDLMREMIKIKSVRSKQYGEIAYLRISSFSEQTAPHVKQELEKIKKHKAKGLVLDLRNNPGGLLNQAIEISDMFLEKGEIVSTKGRDKAANKIYKAEKGDILQGMPIAVLINGGSASAAEIVAGALQDNKRAVLLGTKSFGKGSVQTVMPVMDGKSAIKLTIARYYTPSGNSIQAEGITPDITVESAKIEYLDNKDARRYSESALKGHLVNDKKLADNAKNKEEAKESLEEKKEEVQGSILEDDQQMKLDYQLTRAVDLLKGLILVKLDK